jgi:hypothetical protein
MLPTSYHLRLTLSGITCHVIPESEEKAVPNANQITASLFTQYEASVPMFEDVPVQQSPPSVGELRKSIVLMLKVRNYLDTARRAGEQQAQETGQTLGLVDVLEDCVIMLDDIREQVEDVEANLSYSQVGQ